MLTTLLIYYGGCALGLFGMAKVVEHLPARVPEPMITGLHLMMITWALTENQMECRICRK